MAFWATNKLRLMLALVGGNRSFATSTAPKMKQFAENVRDSKAAQSTISSIWKFLRKPQNAPVAVLLGFIMVPVAIGTHSALQQLMHAPMVVVDKSKRESMQEVDYTQMLPLAHPTSLSTNLSSGRLAKFRSPAADPCLNQSSMTLLLGLAQQRRSRLPVWIQAVAK